MAQNDLPGAGGTASGRRATGLVFHGLDTFATVWLNGEGLGRHQNMFREAVFDASRLVRNTPDQWGRNPERVSMRKAQFGFGWAYSPSER